MTLNFFPDPITFAQVNIAAGATFGVYPASGLVPGYTGLVLPPDPFAPGPPAAYRFPRMNTRQMVFLNTGGNPVLFGSNYGSSVTTTPSPFGSGPPIGTGGGAVNPTEGLNCTRIPAGASLSIDLDTFERRGNFDPSVPVSIVSSVVSTPVTVLFFFGIGGLAGQVDITYVNTFGAF